MVKGPMEIRSGYMTPKLFLLGAGVKEEARRQPERAYGDRGVRHVKSRPVNRAHMEIEKIDHFSEPHPVEQVPGSSSQDEEGNTCSCLPVSVCETKEQGLLLGLCKGEA
jgi:hypothetical protein